ncbi:unnamed protein product [Cyprideis torosa]|uniref:Uncharacterized protein n=1 Tax=Cyprideis torosa TaxID=163714 RepID=A0A7R8WDI2_9CRUS|nr:unnamed protein product [Cyprideis torosa]CAG0888611.1 unnamed protein product [Cyprideis torosa]
MYCNVKGAVEKRVRTPSRSDPDASLVTLKMLPRRRFLEAMTDALRERDPINGAKFFLLSIRKVAGGTHQGRGLLMPWYLGRTVMEYHPRADAERIATFTRDFLYETRVGGVCQLAALDYASGLLRDGKFDAVSTVFKELSAIRRFGRKNVSEVGMYRRFRSLCLALAMYGLLNSDAHDPHDEQAEAALGHFDSASSYEGCWDGIVEIVGELNRVLRRPDDFPDYLYAFLRRKQLGGFGLRFTRECLTEYYADNVPESVWEALRTAEDIQSLEDPEIYMAAVKKFQLIAPNERQRISQVGRILTLIDTPGHFSDLDLWTRLTKLLEDLFEEQHNDDEDQCFEQFLFHVVRGDWDLLHFQSIEEENPRLVSEKALICLAVFGPDSPLASKVESSPQKSVNGRRPTFEYIHSKFTNWRNVAGKTSGHEETCVVDVFQTSTTCVVDVNATSSIEKNITRREKKITLRKKSGAVKRKSSVSLSVARPPRKKSEIEKEADLIIYQRLLTLKKEAQKEALKKEAQKEAY